MKLFFIKFNQGTEVKIYELTDKLVPTGKSFNTSITRFVDWDRNGIAGDELGNPEEISWNRLGKEY